MSDDAKILPFRPRQRGYSPTGLIVSNHYTVRGRLEKRRRTFTLHSSSPEQAVIDATVLLTWYAHNSGPLTEAVWQHGVVELLGESGVIATLVAGPAPLTIVPRKTTRKKRS
jgi:hypothetical protein